MRKTKKIMAFTLAMIMTFGSLALTGCGEEKSSSNSSAESVSSSADTQSETQGETSASETSMAEETSSSDTDKVQLADGYWKNLVELVELNMVAYNYAIAFNEPDAAKKLKKMKLNSFEEVVSAVNSTCKHCRLRLDKYKVKDMYNILNEQGTNYPISYFESVTGSYEMIIKINDKKLLFMQQGAQQNCDFTPDAFVQSDTDIKVIFADYVD